MINKKLVYNKKADNGLDSLYKNIEKDDETPLDCSYLSELNLKIQILSKKNLFVIYHKC